MVDKRYQVFISTSGQEMLPERSVLCQTLVGMGFFAWGLEQRTPLSTALARRQIDDCDYVVMLLGSHYGEQSMSGVSYMQLEYIYAVSKNKPIIAFIHSDIESRRDVLPKEPDIVQEKFHAFRQILQQEVEHIFYFRNLRELELTVRMNMSNMLIRYPALGWVRPQNTQQLNDEIVVLKEKIKGLEAELAQKIPDPLLNVRKVNSLDTFDFEYLLHAYQDGNFKELRLKRQMTWLDILQVLSPVFDHPTPEEYFSIRLNDYLNETGLKDAQTQMKRAHAVARSQINLRALHNIKHQLKQSEWIVPVGRDDRQRLMWQFTEKGSILLKKMTTNQVSL
ncbi:DUF4062 domain-containing protein [Acinetobacter sp. MB5]|uniref:DUF4062 domain-containing protein n=1 Tax=Acinetobacter sp. MB5 TaxID=2069438 RepID=UPI000DCFE39D|nr:DUF4062 domain-containing protein [Acinetobacter sp. MB5]